MCYFTLKLTREHVVTQCIRQVLVAMATRSHRLNRVHYVQRSLRQVQLRWFVIRQGHANQLVGGPLTVQVELLD